LSGETCGSVFWVKLNQRYHFHFPSEEVYVGEIERSLLNVGVANQAAGVGSDIAGVRSFALLHGHKNFRQNISTCCEGQGTRLHGSMPEYVFSLANADGGEGGGEGGGASGVSVDIYAAASISFDVRGADGSSGRATLTVDSPVPYATPAAGGAASTAVKITLALSPPSLAFGVSLRVPGWVAAPSVAIGLNQNASFAAAAAGTYATLRRTWRDGDVLAFDLPMALRATKYVGKNQIENTTRWAYEFGPTLLAARPAAPAAWDQKANCLKIRNVDAADPASWCAAAPPPLARRARSQAG
jgi:DUF1680 family protein